MNENNRFISSLFFSILLNSFFLLLFFNHLLISGKTFNISRNIMIDLEKNFSLPADENIRHKIKGRMAKNSSKFNESKTQKFEAATDKIISGNFNNNEKFENSESNGKTAENSGNSYLERVYQKIEQNKYYPKMEQLRQHEGIVNVSFTIQKDGNIDDVKILKKSNYAVLDKAAYNAVLKCAPFEIVPDNFEEKKVNIDVNIIFNLK